METLISKRSEGKPLIHYWSYCVGAGRANEGLRASWLEQLAVVKEHCGFKYIRFHGLLHDDMFVYKNIDGEDIYNWQYVDDLFDRILEIGLHPFVEFGFIPADMASGNQTQFWWKGNISPPVSYSRWAELIKNICYHWIERYGIDEVLSWYFEIWNEPNLGAFWSGTKSEYFKLYEVSVLAIKAIDGRLRVGGPATSNFVPDDRFASEREDITKQLTFVEDNIDNLQWHGVWIEDFLQYCERNSLPIDFISAHPYPTDFALDGYGNNRGLSRTVNSTKNDLTWLRETIDRSSYQKAEIHLTEWSSSPSPRDFAHDYLPEAAFIIKTNLDASGLVQSMSYWTFTDVFEEGGAGPSIFHGGFGLINYQGIPKPSFHAYKFLNQLGDIELERGNNYIVTKNSKTNKLKILMYNYPVNEVPTAIPMSSYPNKKTAEETQACGFPENINLKISDLNPRQKFSVEILSENNGCAVSVWKDMDFPKHPNREELTLLRNAGYSTNNKELLANCEGLLDINEQLNPWNLVMLSEE